MSDDDKHDQVGSLVSSILTGATDLGVTLLPLVALYNEARQQEEWKEKGIKEWITSDARAAPLLARVLEEIKHKLPDDARKGIIVALGGIPM